MLIAEEFLLLVTSPDGKLCAAGNKVDLGLAGALLSELALAERVTINAKGRLEILSATPLRNPHLDSALAIFVQRQGKKPKDVLGKVAKGLRGRIYGGLAVNGYVREDRRKVLGLFPTSDWVVLNPTAHQANQRTLTGVLLGSTPPDARTGSLIALVHAVDAVPTVFGEQGGLSKRELKQRAKAIAEGNWAGAAVGKAISDAQAAINAAIMASVAAGAASSSGSN
ncbi:GOLPH3/VPS74 family protein [Luteipulveratus mongoliensis]|uniref:GPP34 family phosphoprotein n=1 Tax=Luteipulveratus mongoliensis TaxID=571913 RepID=A0A0K1JRV0_9MICO|nr:GPP34 family phosphoprotein [Luteipulveratus mongoliensis]AKU19275.1 hypothetical protein VV02_24405 [Luteipulveratus mongoliensis]